MKKSIIKHAVLGATVLSLMACGKDAQVAQAKMSSPSAEMSKSNADLAVAEPEHGSVSAQSLTASELMNQFYGKSAYQADGQCWRYESKEHVNYCMSPSSIRYRDGAHGRQAYFYAKGTVLENNSDTIPSGLIGFFALQESDSKWSNIATQKAYECGLQGECNASYMDKTEPELVLLGKSDYYGWVFSDSGNWQGVLVGFNHVIAPKNGEFVSLAEFPEFVEGNQKLRYTFKIEPNEQDEVFPLKIYKAVTSAKKERIVETFDASFNKKTGQYDLPKSIKN